MTTQQIDKKDKESRSTSAFERATELVRQIPNSRYSKQNNSQKDKKIKPYSPKKLPLRQFFFICNKFSSDKF